MTVLAIDDTEHRADADHRNARRRPPLHPQPKHASARPARCRSPLRNHGDVVPQVTSGFRPFAAQCRVGSSSYNDPVGRVDPQGQRAIDAGLAFLDGGAVTAPLIIGGGAAAGAAAAAIAAVAGAVGLVVLYHYLELDAQCLGGSVGATCTGPIVLVPTQGTVQKLCAVGEFGANLVPGVRVSGSCDGRYAHHGTIQIQGTGLSEQYWSWARNKPPTAAEGLAQLETLAAQLGRTDRKKVDQALDKARRRIQDCAPAGCPPMSWSRHNPGIRGSVARVDIAIYTGLAFT
jgi:hypothetical protein